MTTAPGPQTFPAQIWGDGHTHSNWSDGFDSLANNTELFRRYDQDFHVAADHVMIDVSRPGYAHAWEMPESRRRVFRLGWDDIPEYQAECMATCTSDHLTVDGLELTWMNAAEGSFGAPDRAHVLVRDHIDRLPVAEFFRGRSLRDILLELKHREMRPYLAHISSGIPYESLDGSELDGLELHYDIERACHPDHERGFQFWDHWLSQGHHIALTGGSDCHQMDLWAASGARNVVTVDAFNAESVREALLSGGGYVSATWHPDLYRENGFPGNPGTTTNFTSWYWMQGPPSRHDREAVRSRLATMIAATLENDAGRSDRSNHPTLDFVVDGHAWGVPAEARDNARLQIQVSMTVPVRTVRVIAQGEVVWREELYGPETDLTREVHLSLRDCRYVRLEADGHSGDGHDEYILSNPIYLDCS